MEKTSIKKNYLYNLVYQIIILILPIITTPYISRALGATNIGIYSYTVSIVTYFTLFGSLGVSLYGQREIAYVRDNTSKRKKTFIEIILFRFITLTISMIIFYFSFARSNEYQVYYRILLLYLLAASFDISWFFQGLEDFKKTVTRNVIVRLLSVACIFIFVKKPEDLSKYLLIYSLADLLGNLSLWLYLPKYFKGIKVKNINLKKHMVPIITLFIPQIAIKLYNTVDKTMIGYIISNKSELGNYEEANKLINVLFTIVSSLGIVMVPRIANVFASGDTKKLNDYIMKSFRFVFFLAFPITFGIVTVSKEFIPIFLGSGYEKCHIIVNILAPIILLCGITNVIGTQYLLPTKRQKQYTISILVGLIFDIAFNAMLIPKYGAYGAALMTTLAQTLVVIIQCYYIKNDINLKNAFKEGINYAIAGIIMFTVCIILGIFIKHALLSIIIKILFGGITYGIILIILKDEYIKIAIQIIKSKLKIKN
ncbi:MAG: flippase [Clostridia bacterium]|nr:flippase [Clostridia bacterium]